MDVPIINPSDPGSLPPEPSSDPLPSAPPSGPVDSFSAFVLSTTDTNELAQIPILTFSKLIDNTRNELEDTIDASNVFNANNRDAFYYVLAQSALDLATFLSKYMALSFKAVIVYRQNQTQVDTFNAAITAYNASNQATADNIPYISDLNAAINAYNASPNATTLANYTAKAIAYNNYIATRNVSATYTALTGAATTFSNFITTNNATIAQLNVDLAAAGLPTITPQDSYTGSLNVLTSVSTTVPGATIPLSTSQPAVTNTVTSPSVSFATIQNFIIRTLLAFLLHRELLYSYLTSQSDYIGFIQFRLLGSISNLPDSFVLPDPELLSPTNTNESTSGSGVAITSLAASLNNPLMSRIVEQSLANSEVDSNNQPTTPQLLTQFAFLNLLVLTNLGLAAGSSSIRLLAEVLPYVDLLSSPVATAVGVATINEINLAVASGVLTDPILAILTAAFPGVSANSLNSLALQLANASELLLLLLGVSQLGQTLGNSQLTAQVVASTTAEETLGATTPSLTATDVLSNNERVDDLNDILTSSLTAQSNLSSNQLSDIISSNAIDSDNISQSITQELINRGVNATDAQAAGDLADSYVQAEIIGGDILDQSISQDILDQATLSNSLVQTLVANNQFTTVRQLRDALAAEFAKEEGVTEGEALIAATVAVTGQSVPVTEQSVEDLRTQLYNDAIAQLSSLGSTTADSIATELVNAVIGNGEEATDRVSASALIDQRLQTILDTNDENLSQAAVESLHNVLSNTLDLWALGNWIRDPANTLLQTGIQSMQTEPTNFKKDVDIQI